MSVYPETVTNPQPVLEKERLPLPDALRGIALFGILVDNMIWFSSPASVPGYVSHSQGFIDAMIEKLIIIFSMGEFYLMFSFLFGLGFSIQIIRATARESGFLAIYIRRLLSLFVIGLAHAVFLWDGDILMVYAALGLGLLPFRLCAPRIILFWAALFLLASPVTQSLSYSYKYEEGGYARSPAIGAGGVLYRVPAEAAQSIYTQGSYVETVTYRLRNMSMTRLFLLLDQGPSAFAMFLLGLYTGRRRIIENTAEHGLFIRHLLVVGLIIGVVGNLLYINGRISDNIHYELVGFNLGTPAFCLFYISMVALLIQQKFWRGCLQPFAAVGRMSLSNYLLQSLVCTTIFYGYGLGLYGHISAIMGLLLTLAIYLLQISLSTKWLQFFHFGPVEWLLRTFTYLKWQPLKKAVRF